jgi:hypothetical protein
MPTKASQGAAPYSARAAVAGGDHKGLIQHTFPMPDGGGLRLTVAEYLTPALHHVTNAGGARFDRQTGEFVGGGGSVGTLSAKAVKGFRVKFEAVYASAWP